MELIDIIHTYGISGARLASFLGITSSAFNNKLKQLGGRGFSEDEKLMISFIFRQLSEDTQSIQFDKTTAGSQEAKQHSDFIFKDIREKTEGLSLALEIKKRRGRRKLSELKDSQKSQDDNEESINDRDKV